MKTPVSPQSLLSLTALFRNAVWLAGLTVPFVLAWNYSIVAIASVPPLGYWRGFGALFAWQILGLAARGVILQSNGGLPPAKPVRKRRGRR